MNSVFVPDHPLLAVRLATLRDRETPREEFCRTIRQVGIFLAVEAARLVATAGRTVETPMERCEGRRLERGIVLVPVLRAGLGLLEPFQQVFPEASVGHVGMARDEKTLRPAVYLQKLPPGLAEADVFLLDPMLATGHSAAGAITLLKEAGALRVHLVCCLAAPEGIRTVQAAHPCTCLVTASVDRELNERGFILPGLGDAGDRQFGTA
jgi:uracil phosphoribosyltransferase